MKEYNDTSKKIMDVALRLFSEQGYYSTTTRQIANDALVNELTIFRHFKNKANLFQKTTEYHVVETHFDEILTGINNLDFKDAMRLIINRIYELYISNTKLYKVQLKLNDNEKEFVKLKLSRKIVSVLIEYFQSLKVKGKIEGEPQIMAVTLINSLLGAFTVNILSNEDFSNITTQSLLEEHLRQFVNLYGK